MGYNKREMFKLTQRETRKLSETNRFSKLFYKSRYKKPLASKWKETYLSYYERMKDALTDTDTNGVEKQVSDAIRSDLSARLLDITIVAAPEESEDVERKEDTERDEDAGSEEAESSEDENEDKIKLPRVPVWYRNALLKELLDNASPSQKEAVERYEEERAHQAQDPNNQNERLLDIARFVAPNLELRKKLISAPKYVAVARVSNATLLKCLRRSSVKWP